MRSALPIAGLVLLANLASSSLHAQLVIPKRPGARTAPMQLPIPRPSTTAGVPETHELVALPVAGAAIVRHPGGRFAARDARLANALSKHGLSEWRPLRGGSRARADRAVTLVSRRPDFDAHTATRDLLATGAFRAVAPNLKLRLSTTLPNDPDLDLQYGVFDPGDADVQLPEAWDVTKGDSTVRIGIVDTGVDLGHPDLIGQIWTNPGEIAGNGVDDDGNGWIDDVHGYDFGMDDPDPNPNPVFDEATGIDVGFHGTFVAGIAAARTNNGEGIAGAGWNCRIVPMKAADAIGDLTLEALTAAFEYAADNAIPVLNLSLGTTDTTAKTFFQTLVNDALAAGVLCVASAGNDGTADRSFPGSCDSVLAVGATDDANQRATFSQYGPWVDVAAPGATIWSLICRNYEIDEFSQIFYIYLFGWDGERPYMYGDGTSFSCPLAAGIAAITHARWPSLGPLELAHHLVTTGDVRTYDQPIGVKLNSFRAVNSMLAAPDPGGREAIARAWPNPMARRTAIELTLAAPGPARVDVYDAGGRLVRRLLDVERASGVRRVEWGGVDETGVRVPAGVYFAHVRAGEASRVIRIVRLD